MFGQGLWMFSGSVSPIRSACEGQDSSVSQAQHATVVAERGDASFAGRGNPNAS
jgi:hypothetical protein